VPQDVPIGGGATPPINHLQHYEVYFGAGWAAVPPVKNTEFIVVVVQQGSFVLDLKPEGETPSEPGTFLVQPANGETIPIMERHAEAPYYTEGSGVVLDANGNECRHMCLIGDVYAVKVKQGDVVVAKEDGICLWCLLNEHASVDDDKGLLLVTPVVAITGFNTEQFSWVTAWDEARKTFGSTTKNVLANGVAPLSAHTEPVMMAWAFNPAGTKCGGG
jgi:hypothetical protein